jgi:hypothetical protein
MKTSDKNGLIVLAITAGLATSFNYLGLHDWWLHNNFQYDIPSFRMPEYIRWLWW